LAASITMAGAITFAVLASDQLQDWAEEKKCDQGGKRISCRIGHKRRNATKVERLKERNNVASNVQRVEELIELLTFNAFSEPYDVVL